MSERTRPEGVGMRYQDLKIRDTGRMALFGLACGALDAICFFGRARLGSGLGRSLTMWAWSLAIALPIILIMCVWYLVSSPAQNASFLRWVARRFPRKIPQEFDWSLLDASDPDYDVPTIRYLLQRRRGR